MHSSPRGMAMASALLLLVALAGFGTCNCHARPLQAVNRALQSAAVTASFPGGSVNTNGGNVQVAVPGYAAVTTQVSPSPSPSPSPGKASSPSPSPQNASASGPSPSPSPSPVTVDVSVPKTTVAVNSGRRLQQGADVSFPGGSVDTNGGNVDVVAPYTHVTTTVSPSPNPAPKAAVDVNAPGTAVAVNAGKRK